MSRIRNRGGTIIDSAYSVSFARRLSTTTRPDASKAARRRLYFADALVGGGGEGGRTPLGSGTLIVARGIALSFAIVLTRFSMYAHLSSPKEYRTRKKDSISD